MKIVCRSLAPPSEFCKPGNISVRSTLKYLMGRVLYILFMLLLVCQTAEGQKVGEPVWRLEMSGEASTNHNASVRLVDSVAIYVFDSLRKDGTATIVTVYETDEKMLVKHLPLMGL